MADAVVVPLVACTPEWSLPISDVQHDDSNNRAAVQTSVPAPPRVGRCIAIRSTSFLQPQHGGRHGTINGTCKTEPHRRRHACSARRRISFPRDLQPWPIHNTTLEPTFNLVGRRPVKAKCFSSHMSRTFAVASWNGKPSFLRTLIEMAANNSAWRSVACQGGPLRFVTSLAAR